jgi:hypothetical protein
VGEVLGKKKRDVLGKKMIKCWVIYIVKEGEDERAHAGDVNAEIEFQRVAGGSRSARRYTKRRRR